MRYPKKRAKEVKQNSWGKKKMRGRAGVKVKRLGGEVKRVKILLIEYPKAKLAPGKENVDSQVNSAASRRVNSV